MKNRLRQLREENDWTLEEAAEKINDILETHTHLKKEDKRNPGGQISHQTLQKVETGIINIDERYLQIFYILYGASPNEILDLYSEKDKTLNEIYELNEDGLKAVKDFIHYQKIKKID